ncbi:hypothetical protein TCA2_4617 [Paenibacillus sp. TCA20]|uniref:DUF370 domain-containing protein n=1 Tax=Paenibacillus urinalis TaxID=521520 RepID=A0ABY7XH58_9BACL|nr:MULTISPECIES: extracellular matrix/biofilm biosynthesis regulator RemA family protein [Paenibacillus]WDI05049.1 DUF370 domain-containing protein [Paenibacillus urinalis]GAK42125.1 hypothetical protein TCA2_4617 [Paenibacillus sp. TCA20]
MYIDIGFGNFIEESKIISISRPDSSPIRRMMTQAKDDGRYVDMTQGRKTRSIILTSGVGGMVVIGSPVAPTTVVKRADGRFGPIISSLDVIGEGQSKD